MFKDLHSVPKCSRSKSVGPFGHSMRHCYRRPAADYFLSCLVPSPLNPAALIGTRVSPCSSQLNGSLTVQIISDIPAGQKKTRALTQLESKFNRLRTRIYLYAYDITELPSIDKLRRTAGKYYQVVRLCRSWSPSDGSNGRVLGGLCDGFSHQLFASDHIPQLEHAVLCKWSGQVFKHWVEWFMMCGVPEIEVPPVIIHFNGMFPHNNI